MADRARIGFVSAHNPPAPWEQGRGPLVWRAIFARFLSTRTSHPVLHRNTRVYAVMWRGLTSSTRGTRCPRTSGGPPRITA